ncbi:SPC97 (YHR172W) [Zygosaccharomyces parabailii]|nr:SPC97 (YHR172W) [Zygosaccharomyces parabailii]CDH12420.1 related to Spindle pole body component SPC97 [Zygosaccharomyces bailii ISA1307]
MEVRPVEDYVMLNLERERPPLLGRLVNYQPLSNVNPKFRSYPLRELASPDQNRIKEALLVRDLLNVLVGLEGAYIRYNNKYDPYSDNVPEFKIAKTIDLSFKSFSKRLAKLGKYYIVLGKVAEHWSDPQHGVVLHRLGYEIGHFLQQTYLRFISSKLEPAYKNNVNFSIREMEQLINEGEIAKQMDLLYAVCDRIDKETTKRQTMDRTQVDFDNFMSDLKDQGQLQSDMILATDTRILPVAKGGVVLRILQELIQENFGDRSGVDFLKGLLRNISTDYCTMLENWLTKGELQDPYDEFMIVDTMRQLKDTPLSLKYGDRLWDTQYMIRKDGLPRAFTVKDDGELLFKILITGKLLNVVRTSLGIRQLPRTPETYDFRELMEDVNWELCVDEWYHRANAMCMELFQQGYQIDKFLQQLQCHFFGYRNGHNIMKFLSGNMVDLTRRYRAQGSEDSRIRRNFELEHRSNKDLVIQLLNLQLDPHSFAETIMQYGTASTDSSERLLSANNFEALRKMLLQDFHTHSTQVIQGSVIHHLQFELLVPYPLNVVVTRTCTVQYQLISRYLFLLQYYSRLLDDTWVEINKNQLWRSKFENIVRKNFLRPCRLLHNRMNQFIKLLLEYFTTDVLDREMLSVTQTRPRGITVLSLQTHLQEALTNVMTNCCLSQLIQIQLQILEIVHKFCKFITSLRMEMMLLQQQDLTRLPILTNYTKLVYRSFDQHVAAFKEGLFHYNSESAGASDSRRDTSRLLCSLQVSNAGL